MIALIGLGYVGLPLAVAFAKKHKVVGFDINTKRIEELNSGFDRTGEIDSHKLKNALSDNLIVSNQLKDIELCNFYIVTVPTPVDEHNKPDLTPLIKSSETVGKVIKKGDYVVYESTVYPGVTEDVCIPIVEKISGLKFNVDFFAGYSPERINPGDKLHTVEKILKITSGSTPEAAEVIDQLYNSVIEAGTYKASSIKVAEAAKVIENTQRDINIAFVNELSKIFHLLGIDTQEVLNAAGTKWNFIPFKPGLVGGHCIGVDPFYLAQKAQEVGYHPEIILAGRRINDSMGKYIAERFVKSLIKKKINPSEQKTLILGITFKENCPDIRNSLVPEILYELESFNIPVFITDPLADSSEVKHEYNIQLTDYKTINFDDFDSIILAVSHTQFMDNFSKFTSKEVIFDIKSILPKELITERL